jgi:DNA-binding MarR family transcriptional regulator
MRACPSLPQSCPAPASVRIGLVGYGLLNQLVIHGEMSVGSIATALRITHVSVSQASQSLEKGGFIVSVSAPGDGSRRMLRLTPSGENLVARLTPVWKAFNEAAEELNDEAGDVVKLLDRLDDALSSKSMFDRILRRLDSAGNSGSA